MNRIQSQNLARSDLSGTDFRILHELFTKLDYEKPVIVNQSQVGRDLGVARSRVSRSIRRLLRLGVLLEGQRIGNSRFYWLNPNYGSQSSHRNHVVSLADYRQHRVM